WRHRRRGSRQESAATAFGFCRAIRWLYLLVTNHCKAISRFLGESSELKNSTLAVGRFEGKRRRRIHSLGEQQRREAFFLLLRFGIRCLFPVQFGKANSKSVGTQRVPILVGKYGELDVAEFHLPLARLFPEGDREIDSGLVEPLLLILG